MVNRFICNITFIIIIIIIRQPLCPVVVRRPQHAVSKLTLSCAVLCHITSLQYLSRSSLHRLAGLPCRLFSSYNGLQVVTREVHRSSLRRLMWTISFFAQCWLYLWLLSCPWPRCWSFYLICDVEHTSFHFGLCGLKFVLCLCGQCLGLCTICHSWQHTGVVHMSLQADGKAALKISRCLAYAMILRCISLPWLFFLRL